MIPQRRIAQTPFPYRPLWPHVFLARPVPMGTADPDQRLSAALAAGSPLPLEEPCIPLRQACRVILQLTAELLALTAERAYRRRDTRRQRCHIRQIAMYVCHVQLRIPQADVGHAFGRDRTTVRHACAMVEDRRDAKAYDEFVAAVERLAVLVFQPAEGVFDD